jgi:hypothetical protein
MYSVYIICFTCTQCIAFASPVLNVYPAMHWVQVKQRLYTEYRWSKGYTLSTGEAKDIHWVQVKQRLYTEYWWSKGYTLHTGLNLHIWWERPRVMDRVSPLGGWIVRLWYRKTKRVSFTSAALSVNPMLHRYSVYSLCFTCTQCISYASPVLSV